MTHIITSLCLRDGACIEVCPVECIIPGTPSDEWPWMYIDPDTCIDCGACIPECPFEAIFPEDEVPGDFSKAGMRVSAPQDSNFADKATEEHEVESEKGKEHIMLKQTYVLADGDVIDLRADNQKNYDYFKGGPGYPAK
ncbi:MAG: ferredoxin family protein [Chloroflexi bacterium]|nr:ferredoxin family protein [Chloroflexota bacterium]